MRKFLCAVIVSAFVLLISGCWNYRDLEDIAVAAGMAVDKSGDGQYLLTTEIVHPADKELESFRIQAKGRTILDCMRNTGEKLRSKVYWPNAQVMILSEEVAKEGLLPLADIAERNRELRPTLQLVVSKENTARELLETKGITTPILSEEIASILQNSGQNISKARTPALYKVIDDICSQGRAVTLPAVKKASNGDEEAIELDGTAVFDREKLAGYLSGEESKALLFIRNEIRGGLLVARDPDPAAKRPFVTLEIKSSETTVTPERTNGGIAIRIRIKTETVMGENDTGKSYVDKGQMGYLQERAQAMVQGSVQTVIEKVRQEYNADIFGFGSTVRSRMPDLWKEIGSDWYNGVFRNLTVTVTSEIRIVDNGLLREPVAGGGA